MTNEEIINSMRQLGYPDDLLDSEIEESIAWAIRRANTKYPMMVLGTFTTVACQQVYDLFNPVYFPDTRQGLFPGGLWVYELFGATQGSGGDLDVFGIAPLIQGLSIVPGTISRMNLYTPGDWVLWDLNWSAFMHRFAELQFDQLEGRYGAPVRIYPVPTTEQQVLIRFTMPRTVDNLTPQDDDWFFHLVEANACQLLANKFSLSAGTKVGDVADTGKTAEYWRKLAKDNQDEAGIILEERARISVHPATRSHGA